ncbi:hypothetical protein E2C01_063781 [Portunus trituberculatus]|uniref:Uncharacterized protein n=2 Tax=Portunus trituberculatus TaxID=210409 RepID=A0A5B7HHB3_PORTR|nr:hypothetical protein [Portunus trituberculatus]
MIGTRLKMATQLLDSSWATFRIFAHANELHIKIVSENHSFKYSTSAFISTINHQEVNKVSCSGEGCQHYIDLKCPYSDSKSNHTEYNEPESISSTSENKTGYYWLFYVMVSLVVVACLLLFIWRNERQKFRIRWWRHSQNVRRMGRDSCQAECTNEVSTGIGTMSSLAFPNPAYDATGDCD